MHGKAKILFLVLSALLLNACGTLQVGWERTATLASSATAEVKPTRITAAATHPSPTASRTSDAVSQTERPTRVPATKPVEKPLPPPTPQPTIPTPTVPLVSFFASPSPAEPTGTITLTWTVRGAASVTVQWIDKQSESVVHQGLPLAGSMSVDVHGIQFSDGDSIRFALSVYDEQGQPTVGWDGRTVDKRLSLPLQTQLEIVSFTASPNPVERGGTVTLAWEAPHAHTASITRVSPEGVFLDTEVRDLPARGSIALQIPTNFTTSISYYLGARDINGVLAKAFVTVDIACPFDEHIAPECPLTRDYLPAVYQPFERGHMVWRGDARQIVVLYQNGSYETVEDTWQEGESVQIDEPPQGRIRPERGFGKLWASDPAVREGLGWATAPESNYTMLLETVRPSVVRHSLINAYLTLPDDQVVHLYAFSSSWEILSPTSPADGTSTVTAG